MSSYPLFSPPLFQDPQVDLPQRLYPQAVLTIRKDEDFLTHSRKHFGLLSVKD